MTEPDGVQRSRIDRFYEIVAGCLPVEGRDYRLSFDLSRPGEAKASFEPVTPLGRELMAAVGRAMEEERDRRIVRRHLEPGEIPDGVRSEMERLGSVGLRVGAAAGPSGE